MQQPFFRYEQFINQSIKPHTIRHTAVHSCAHNSPSHVPVHGQMKPVKTLPHYLFKIHFNITLPPMTSSSKWSCPFKSPHQNPTWITPLPHICHISCLFTPTNLVSANCTTTLIHTSLCLVCLSLQVSSMSVQLTYKFSLYWHPHNTSWYVPAMT